MLDGVIARLRQRIPWRPGARRLLRELNDAGVPCALVTMSWRRFVDPIVAALPPGTFDAVITGDEVPAGQGKPNPTPYLMGAGFCAADPRDCVAIEDSPTGVRSARDAGCRVLGVPNVRSSSGLEWVDDRRLAARRHDSRTSRHCPRRRHRPTSRRQRTHDRRLLVLGGLAVVAVLALAFAAAPGWWRGTAGRVAARRDPDRRLGAVLDVDRDAADTRGSAARRPRGVAVLVRRPQRDRDRHRRQRLAGRCRGVRRAGTRLGRAVRAVDP